MCVVLVASQAQETKLHRERSTERKMVEVYVVAKQSDASKVCCYCYVKRLLWCFGKLVLLCFGKVPEIETLGRWGKPVLHS